MKENLYRKLLKEYCDALISVQDKGNDPAFRGGIYCRSCKMIHGRCPDAVFGFVVMAKISGDKKYLQAAKDVFAYGENMLCTDGGLYNDAQAAWRYTTTFHQIAVIEALRAGAGLLDEETVAAFEKRARGMAEWLYANLDEHSPANINYATTNGLAMALSGKYFREPRYLQRAAHLIDYAMAHISENGLLYGESKPHDKLSAKHCRSIDIGYNVEESVPALVKYTFEVGDEGLKEKVFSIVKAHLNFLLPDGGWDNSFGNRNNKWTYWGSRTSDGCAPMFLLFADRDPSFAEAALRNTEMLQKCSVDGFLYGGPHYHKHSEHACTHHLFEHINSLAFAIENIDEKYLSPERTTIPSDSEDAFRYYAETRTYKLAKGAYQATVTDYDFDIAFSGHATGATLTALYHKDVGAMIMGSVTDYVLVEPTNMQQALDREHHRSLLPRFVREKGDDGFSSTFFLQAEMQGEKTQNGYTVSATTGLAKLNGEVADGVKISLRYTLTRDGMRLEAKGAKGTKFLLPLIAGRAIAKKGKLEKTDEIFFLTGGFTATEYTLLPDEDGCLDVLVQA